MQIDGTEAADSLYGTSGNDVIHGLGGDDTISAGSGNDVLYGDDGNDYLWGGVGFDRLYGGLGDDTLADSVGGDRLDGGAGIDTLSIHLFTGPAVTFVFDPAGPVTTPWGSTAVHFEQLDILGTTGNDSFTGGSGNDTVRGWDGDDTLRGGAGNDFVIGDNGNDRMLGQAGNDTLNGGGGDDMIRGGAGDDFLVGGNTFDVFNGHDLLEGGPGADRFRGGLGPTDISYAHSRAGVYVDLVHNFGYGGDAQGDTFDLSNYLHGQVIGSAFNDVIVGGEQQVGGSGDDRLIAGAQAAGVPQTIAMTGDAGADWFTFQFHNRDFVPNVRILDFDQAELDRVDLSAVDARPAPGDQAFDFIGTSAFSGAAGELRYEVIDGDTVLQMQMNSDPYIDATITLAGVYALTAADFLL